MKINIFLKSLSLKNWENEQKERMLVWDYYAFQNIQQIFIYSLKTLLSPSLRKK